MNLSGKFCVFTIINKTCHAPENIVNIQFDFQLITIEPDHLGSTIFTRFFSESLLDLASGFTKKFVVT